MLLLADENFPKLAVPALRAAGHDVIWVRDELPGAADHDVLQLAQAQERILVTFDKDFGELAFRAKLPSSCGIILFRLRPVSPEYIGRVVVEVLSKVVEWSGHFAVVEENRIRSVPLPAS